jgi:hypothetical protein
MKRSVIDVILRALKNALANWPLVVFRVIEYGVFVGMVFFAVITTVVPILVTAGLGKLNFHDVQASSEAISRFILEHLVLIGWLIGASTVAFGVMLAIHSFIVAGSARVYRDADVTAPPNGALATFKKFDVDVFWDAAWENWWRIFWIYNIGAAVAGSLVLAPVLLACLLILAAPNLALLIVIVTCIVTFLLGIVAVVGGGLWILRAIPESVARNCTAREALTVSYRAVRADFGRHFGAALLLAIITIGGSAFAQSMVVLLFNSDNLGNLVQVVAWGLSGGWWLASFMGLIESPA